MMFDFAYTGKKDSRLTCLQSENLFFLQQIRQHLINASKQHCGVRYDPMIEVRLKHAAIIQNPRAFKHWKKRYEANQVALKRYHSWCLNQKHLMDPSIWKRMLSVVPQDKFMDLVYFEKRFLRHGAFAHYSSKALYTVAFEILPSLEAYVDLAQQEWRAFNKTMDPTTQRDFKAFLTKCTDKILTIKHALAESMAERLILSSQSGDVKADDVLYDTILKLKDFDVLTSAMSLPTPSRGLTPKITNHFLQFIAQGYSKRALFMLKHEVKWLNSHSHYVTKHEGKTLYSVPKTFLPFLDRGLLAKAWDQLTGSFDVKDYWIKRQHLIASIRLLEVQPIENLGQDAVPATIQKLDELVSELIVEFQAIQANTPHGIWANIWRADTRAKMSQLTVFLVEKLTLIADKSIALLRNRVVLLESQCALDKNSELDDAMLKQIQQLITTIKLLGTLTASQRAQIVDLNNRFIKLHERRHPEKPLIDTLLNEVSQGKLKGGGRLQALYDHSQNLKLVSSGQFILLQRQAKDARACTVTVIKQELMKFKNSHNRLLEPSLILLSRALVFIRELGDKYDIDEIQKFASNLLVDYAAKGKHRHKGSLWFLDAEKLLLTIAEQLQLPEIRQAILPLQAARRNPDETEHEKACGTYHAAYELQQLRERAKAGLLQYECALWRLLEQRYSQETLKRFDDLITEAIAQSKMTVAALPLSLSMKTVLGIGKSDAIHNWIDQILWLKTHKDPQVMTEKNLQDLIATVERRTATTLTQVKQQSLQQEAVEPVDYQPSLGALS